MHHPHFFSRAAKVYLSGIFMPGSWTARAMASASSPLYPRAAVAVTVQSTSSGIPHYLLVQRANPPDQGKWSLPGGKIDVGETTLDAAKREIFEETQLGAESCQWLSHPFMTTDAIVKERKNGKISFHYLIAQCFARAPCNLPDVSPNDDALDTRWFSLDEIQTTLAVNDQTSQFTIDVIQRAEDLDRRGALL